MGPKRKVKVLIDVYDAIVVRERVEWRGAFYGDVGG